MVIDNLLEFADNAAIGGSTGRRLIGDVVDLGAAPRDLGPGADLYLVVRMSAAATSGGSATVVFEFCSDAQADIATDGNATIHLASAAIPVAQLTLGRTVFAVKIPAGVLYERFMGIVANVGTAALTAGSIDAFMTHDVNAWRAYADAVN